MIKKIVKNLAPYGAIKAYENYIISHRPATVPTAAEPELIKMSDVEQPIFNSDGEKMRSFYLRDFLAVSNPYSFVMGASPKHIHWDRYNYCLPIHFYSHDNVLRIKQTAKKRFAYFIESQALLGNDYRLLDNDPGLHKEFNAIFTTKAEHLEKFDNARFCPAAGVWYGNPYGGGTMDPLRYTKKTKDVSIISSDKTFCQLHEMRIETARKLRREGLADAYGTFDGGDRVFINETLDDYRFSIAYENDIQPFYFTEKLMNCFAAQTVPVYVGATHIGKFFNTDGIIMTTRQELLESPEKVLKQCTPQEYERRKDAIIDNYNRVQKYRVIEDYLYDNYKEMFEL